MAAPFLFEIATQFESFRRRRDTSIPNFGFLILNFSKYKCTKVKFCAIKTERGSA